MHFKSDGQAVPASGVALGAADVSALALALGVGTASSAFCSGPVDVHAASKSADARIKTRIMFVS